MRLYHRLADDQCLNCNEPLVRANEKTPFAAEVSLQPAHLSISERATCIAPQTLSDAVATIH